MGPRAVTHAAGALLLTLASCRLLLASLSEPSQQRVLGAARLLLRPLALLAACVMRTPIAPLVRIVLRVLRFGVGRLLALLRLSVSVCTGCAGMCRRNLIVALGGKVDTLEKSFTD